MLPEARVAAKSETGFDLMGELAAALVAARARLSAR
jgi:hypothetical protein